jgi:uncharacterized protein (TIGR02117 family)
MKRLFKILACASGGIIAFVALYMLVFLLLSTITVNNQAEETPDGIDIYLFSNGVHVDIVLPLKNEYKDWSTQIDYRNTLDKDSALHYLAFGWGDKGFYLETPAWSELQFTVAFKAAFYLSTTAMHTTFYGEMTENELCRRIRVDRATYQKIVQYVENRFQRDAAGNFIPIFNVPLYGRDDSFYEAKGRYSLFFTCNTWVNQCLKQAGLKACVWTPFQRGIID